MIKNVIFDVGRVLIKYSPKKILEDFGYSEIEVEDILELVFQNEMWQELDRGRLTKEEFIYILGSKRPDLKEKIEYVMDNWQDHLSSIEENTSILKDIKEKGFNLYVLSNFESTAFKKLKDRFKYFDLFDDIVISCDVKMLKPDEGIYLYLLNKHGLIPEECLFIDDMKMNIETAKRLGMNTIWFRENINIKEELEKMGIL